MRETSLEQARPYPGLGLRLATSAVLVPLFVGTIWIGGLVFLAGILALTAVGTVELFRLAHDKPYRARYIPGLALALALPAVLYGAPADAEIVTGLLVAGAVGVAAAQMLDRHGTEAMVSVAFTVFAALYVGLLFGHLVLLREIARARPGLTDWVGAVLLGLPLFLTWVNDTAAYFIGRRWGRRRLLARVSPGKSLEGAVSAGIVTLAAAFLAVWMVDRLVPVFDPIDGLALGILIAIAAPCGDLIVSAFKRDAGVKDMSQVVPGHGGVLDRFDSVLVAVPLSYYYLVLCVL
ncbi:MAG TPA: phosphatidate cytidylyltransferase [Gemmatimonadota bacterium]|nr:phosphatidate cytidylyltransferase [Gemmatimonadota bacterium]